jgi:acetolactate synthase-1/2/3 large subunit
MRSRDLLPTLDAAFNADRPTLIVVPIDYNENKLLAERLGRVSCPLEC